MTPEVKAYMESLGFEEPDMTPFGRIWRRKDLNSSVIEEAVVLFYNAQRESNRKLLERVKLEVVGLWEDAEFDFTVADLREKQRQAIDSLIKEL